MAERSSNPEIVVTQLSAKPDSDWLITDWETEDNSWPQQSLFFPPPISPSNDHGQTIPPRRVVRGLISDPNAAPATEAASPVEEATAVAIRRLSIQTRADYGEVRQQQLSAATSYSAQFRMNPDLRPEVKHLRRRATIALPDHSMSTFTDYVLVVGVDGKSPYAKYFTVDRLNPSKILPKVGFVYMPLLKELRDFRMVYSRSFVYIIGGILTSTDDMNAEVFRYNPIIGMWAERAPMPQGRTRFAAIDLNDYLYVIGGQLEDGTITNSVIRYDAVWDRWREAPALPKARADHAVCVVGNVIYVSGGVEKDDGIPDTVMWKFDAEHEVWRDTIYKFGIPEPKKYHRMVTVNKRIFCIGGVTYDRFNQTEDNASFCRLKTDVNLDDGERLQWKKGPGKLINHRNHLGSVRVGQHLYVFGGVGENSHMVEYLDLRKKTWHALFPEDGQATGACECVKIAVPLGNTMFNQWAVTASRPWPLW